MAHFQSWRCPDCAGSFRHLHHPDDAPPPDRCPLCGSWMRDDEPPQEVFIPQAPRVRHSEVVKAVDDVYYGMEDASRFRAELMAQNTPGASASDFSHTLITDMNDRQKPGDIAYKPPPPNPVTQQMEFLRQRQGQGSVAFSGPNGVPNYQPGIPQGGLGAMKDIQTTHFQNMGRLVGGGTLNRK